MHDKMKYSFTVYPATTFRASPPYPSLENRVMVVMLQGANGFFTNSISSKQNCFQSVYFVSFSLRVRSNVSVQKSYVIMSSPCLFNLHVLAGEFRWPAGLRQSKSNAILELRIFSNRHYVNRGLRWRPLQDSTGTNVSGILPSRRLGKCQPLSLSLNVPS